MSNEWLGYNLEAEQSVIGGLIQLANSNTAYSVYSMLTADDFHKYEHKKIYEAASEMFRTGRPIEVFTVAEYMNDNMSELPYLRSIYCNVPSAANIHSYATAVRKKSLERSAMLKLNESIAIITRGGDTQANISEVLNVIAGINVNSITDDIEASHVREVALNWLNSYEDRLENPELGGITCGIPQLDELFGTRGIQETDLIVLGARPKMGKTQAAAKIQCHVGLDLKKPTCIFSMEMANEQIVERLIVQRSYVNSDKFYSGMDDHEYAKVENAIKPMIESSMYMDDRCNLTLNQIETTIRKLTAKVGKIGLTVIDYLTLMQTEKADRNDLAYGAITKGLKALCKKYKTPILLLCQLSRSVDSRPDKHPIMSDLRESGQIEQDADRIIFLYKESVYNKDSKMGGVTEFDLVANRHGGTGTAYQVMDKGWFSDISHAQLGVMQAENDMGKAKKGGYGNAGGFQG